MDLPGTRFFKGDSIYGPWIPREGDNLIFRIEKVDTSPASGSSVEATFTIYTKDSETTGDGSVISGVSIVITDGTAQFSELLIQSVTSGTPFGLDELVRWKCVVGGDTDGEWLLLRLFPAVFFDDADGTKT
ncbi:MAG: hypothetical protein H6718_00130 [Polyangiaceae bacterium]|nr:hypothetical protein [Polyangiaceae bacterium]MCB9870142.1 hypothetical protein [Planctomycetota bacterium]